MLNIEENFEENCEIIDKEIVLTEIKSDGLNPDALGNHPYTCKGMFMKTGEHIVYYSPEVLGIIANVIGYAGNYSQKVGECIYERAKRENDIAMFGVATSLFLVSVATKCVGFVSGQTYKVAHSLGDRASTKLSNMRTAKQYNKIAAAMPVN